MGSPPLFIFISLWKEKVFQASHFDCFPQMLFKNVADHCEDKADDDFEVSVAGDAPEHFGVLVTPEELNLELIDSFYDFGFVLLS